MLLDEINQDDVEVDVMDAPSSSPFAFWTEATKTQRIVIVACIVALLALLIAMQINLRSTGSAIRSISAEQAQLLSK